MDREPPIPRSAPSQREVRCFCTQEQQAAGLGEINVFLTDGERGIEKKIRYLQIDAGLAVGEGDLILEKTLISIEGPLRKDSRSSFNQSEGAPVKSLEICSCLRRGSIVSDGRD